MDWSYIACFIDTDGCIGSYWQTTAINNRYLYIGLYFGNTYKKVLEDMKIFLNCGRIREIKPKNKLVIQKKPMFRLEINKQADCLRILENIVDKLIIKREKGEMALKHLKERAKTLKCVDNLYYCSACQTYLPKSSFHRNKTKKYGIQSYCKTCFKLKISLKKKALTNLEQGVVSRNKNGDNYR